MNANLEVQARIALYDDALATGTSQYFCNKRQFALPVAGNKVHILQSGRETLEQIAAAMTAAEKFIWIADWQMAFDVELKDRGSKEHNGRLWKIFESIIQSKPVQIRVLLYGSPADSKPGTYDGLVSDRLNALNKKGYPGKIIVKLQYPTSSQVDSWDYSHHQKFVVVDGKVAFIGGIDLTYGRMETPEFDVVIDPAKHILNEAYNPCATRVRAMTPEEEELVENGFMKPYSALLEEGCQARMPWQDVHIKLSGPAAVDVHRNFVRRWNMLAKWSPRPRSLAHETPSSIALIDQKWLDHHGATALLKSALKPEVGGAIVQIVRSASSGHLRGESHDSQGNFAPPPDLNYLTNPAQRPVLEAALKGWHTQHQDNILNAMLNAIDAAENYIYIETQFFISDFGTYGPMKTVHTRAGAFHYYPVDSSRIGNENNGIKNRIVDALAARIDYHIQAGTNFHVYLVLPVHPEGSIADGSTWKQHWLALASIHHGSKSLIGRIKRSLVKWGRSAKEWNKYLTVLNMRNFGVAVQYARDPKTYREDLTQEIGRYVITEQIYIHSKLMIVDDAVAIVGSANINDRSLTGNGDTEIAAVIVDSEGVERRSLGDPKFPVTTRRFARELRRSLWKKHFGFAIDEKNYFESVARVRAKGIAVREAPPHPPRKATAEKALVDRFNVNLNALLDEPCAPDTISAIQRIAAVNQKTYETVFTHLPRNGMKQFEDIISRFSCPYPVAADEEASRLIRQAEYYYGHEVNALRQSLFLTAEQRAVRQAAAEKRRVNAIGAIPKMLGSSTLGVVPPALGKAFMTSSLLPHQKRALEVPMSTFYRRYVTYADNTVHNVPAAIKYLSENLLGFFVQAPLNWGEGADVDGSVDHHMSVDIAHNESPALTEKTSFHG